MLLENTIYLLISSLSYVIYIYKYKEQQCRLIIITK